MASPDLSSAATLAKNSGLDWMGSRYFTAMPVHFQHLGQARLGEAAQQHGGQAQVGAVDLAGVGFRACAFHCLAPERGRWTVRP